MTKENIHEIDPEFMELECVEIKRPEINIDFFKNFLYSIKYDRYNR
jgi:hypothetical protein